MDMKNKLLLLVLCFLLLIPSCNNGVESNGILCEVDSEIQENVAIENGKEDELIYNNQDLTLLFDNEKGFPTIEEVGKIICIDDYLVFSKVKKEDDEWICQICRINKDGTEQKVILEFSSQEPIYFLLNLMNVDGRVFFECNDVPVLLDVNDGTYNTYEFKLRTDTEDYLLWYLYEDHYYGVKATYDKYKYAYDSKDIVVGRAILN